MKKIRKEVIKSFTKRAIIQGFNGPKSYLLIEAAPELIKEADAYAITRRTRELVQKACQGTGHVAKVTNEYTKNMEAI